MAEQIGERLDQLGAVTMFVEDPQVSKGFYGRVFGAAVAFEDADSVAFRFGEMFVNFLVRREAGPLIGPGRVASGGEAGALKAGGATFQLTVFVKDVNAVCERLRVAGVALLNGPMDRPWGMRTACFADPDGHVWEVAQQL